MITTTKYHYTESITKPNEIKHTLEKHGVVFFTNINSIADGIKLGNQFGHIKANIDAKDNGITKISETTEGKNKKNSLAFTQLGLYPHTDRSPLENPPKYLLNWTSTASVKGGNSLFVDGHKLYQLLKEYHPSTLQQLKEKVATFSDSINTRTDSIFSKDSQDNITIRFRNDNCVVFDDSVSKAIEILKKIIDQETVSIPLTKGEAYLIDNTRWLHGREPYEGHRVIYRLHIDPDQ